MFLLVNMMMGCCGVVLWSVHHAFPERRAIRVAFNVFSTCGTVMFVYPTYKFIRHKFNDDDFKEKIVCMTYIGCLWFFVSTTIALLFLDQSVLSSTVVIIYILRGAIMSVLMTTLVGRMMRMQVSVIREMLERKRVFVRYVSHEVRSPLNVVFAGLELAKKSLLQLVCGDSNAVAQICELLGTTVWWLHRRPSTPSTTCCTSRAWTQASSTWNPPGSSPQHS